MNITDPTIRDAEFKAEYAKDRAKQEAIGISEEQYVLSRRLDEGLETLQDQTRRQQLAKQPATQF